MRKKIKKVYNSKVFSFLFLSLFIFLFSNCSVAPNYEALILNKGEATFSIIYKSNGGSGTMRPQEVHFGVKEVLAPNSFITPNEEYKFGYWNTKADGQGISYLDEAEITLNVTNNLTLYAIWIPVNSYRITFTSSRNIDVVNPNNLYYTVDQNITLLPLPDKDNFEFEGWYTTSTFDPSTRITGWERDTKTGDIELYARWLNHNTYNITYKSENVTQCTYPEKTTYTPLETVTLGNPTYTGPNTNNFIFDGWYTSNEFTESTKITGWEPETLEEDITLYAKWLDKTNYKITYNSTITCANPNVTTYTVEDTVTLVEPTTTIYGYRFEGWYTNSTFDESTRITGWNPNTKSGNITLYAKWHEFVIDVDKTVVIFNGPSDAPVQVTAVYDGDTSVPVDWISDDYLIATVNNGLITPKAEGLTTIKAFVGSVYTSVAVIVMRYDANTTYDPGSVQTTGNTGSAKYYSDAANQVAFAITSSGKLDFNGRLSTTDSWKQTTYNNNGWTWRINNTDVKLGANGDVKSGNLYLSVRPVLAYDSSTGISYVVIYQILTNAGKTKQTGLRFGSHADIMLGDNDSAPIEPTTYGASMYDTTTHVQFDIYAKGGPDCTPVDTLWFGFYNSRTSNIYGASTTQPVLSTDTGMAYSWQNITLEPGESIIKSVRMTLVRCTK